MKITQKAFTGSGKLLKGGLHCHTTRSDGKGTPEEVIRLHAANGYDFLALTDHRYYNYVNYAPETGITIIPGMEMDGNITTGDALCFHIVSIGPARENGNGFAQDERLDSYPVRNQFEFQPVLDRLHAANNLTIYAHPEWSCTPVRLFEHLHGNFAMELWNSGCAIETDCDQDNGTQWDELLVSGKRIFGVATDDGHAMYQHCRGWVRVNAENNIDSILAALKEGAFYASCGPEIYNFYVEDGKAVVECSPCAHIQLITGVRPTRAERNEDSLITRAELELKDGDRYVRATMVDAEGRRAWSNPIFLK